MVGPTHQRLGMNECGFRVEVESTAVASRGVGVFTSRWRLPKAHPLPLK